LLSYARRHYDKGSVPETESLSARRSAEHAEVMSQGGNDCIEAGT
jgi:hypothetical protein